MQKTKNRLTVLQRGNDPRRMFVQVNLRLETEDFWCQINGILSGHLFQKNCTGTMNAYNKGKGRKMTLRGAVLHTGLAKNPGSIYTQKPPILLASFPCYGGRLIKLANYLFMRSCARFVRWWWLIEFKNLRPD